MPYDLFWHGENEAIDYYLEKFKHEQRIQNSQMHLQATYFLKALQEVLQVKDIKEIFPRAPFTLSFDKKDNVETQEQIEADMKAMFANFKKIGGK